MRHQKIEHKHIFRNISSSCSEYNPPPVKEKSLPCFSQSFIQLDLGTLKTNSALPSQASCTLWLLLRNMKLPSFSGALNPCPFNLHCFIFFFPLTRLSWLFLHPSGLNFNVPDPAMMSGPLAGGILPSLLHIGTSQMQHNQQDITFRSQDLAQWKEHSSFRYVSVSFLVTHILPAVS